MANNKSKKQPAQSALGQGMEQIIERLNTHKSHKKVNEALVEMDSAVAGAPPTEPGPVKTAYLLGVKYASDIAMGNQGEVGHTEPIINILRRGWPDPGMDKKEKDKSRMGDMDYAQSIDNFQNKAQINSQSPKVSI